MLTKTDFLTFLESPLHLWAKKHGQLDETKPNLYAQHLKRQGYEIQKLAHEFMKQKVAREYPNAELTFESTMVNGSFQARIDVLVHDKTYDTYDLYEIKSGMSIKPEHEYDVTFQYLVGKAEYNVHKIYLVRVNKDFIKEGEIDLTQFFVIDDMMPAVAKLTEEVYELRDAALAITEASEVPLASHCYKPHDCPCKHLCHPNLPEFPIYDLSKGSQKQYEALNAQGIEELGQITDQIKLTARQELQVRSMHSGQPQVDSLTIYKELASLTYPLYFLDYETFMPGIPIHDKYHPYQHIVFQYSLHVMESPEAEVKHYEYLVTDTDEPSEALVKRLTSVISDTGSVIVWNKHFENGRNKELAALQPEYADKLKSIIERTYDLGDIFSKGYYVDYRFHGSWSIKKVLPILVPELSYEGMDIAEGTMAMISWYQMTHDMRSAFSPDSIKVKDKTKQDLLKYCELDTWAMVKIWRKLLVINDAF